MQHSAQKCASQGPGVTCFSFDLWPSLDCQSLLDQVTEENKYLINNLLKSKLSLEKHHLRPQFKNFKSVNH